MNPPLTVLSSRAVPMMAANIDTDVITPMKRLTNLAPGRPLSHYAFEPLRYSGGDGDGGEPLAHFPLNDPRFAGAGIMLCGENFGCGSSRESAPAAIAALGIRCLIGSSFGDIFFNNCFQQGVLPVELPAETVTRLAEQALGEGLFEVDLPRQVIVAPSGERIGFSVNPLRKRSLTEGLDDIGMTLKRDDEISAFQARDREARPWIYDLRRRARDR